MIKAPRYASQLTCDNAWAWAQKLFQSGSPEFVEAIRAVANAKELAPFAETWYTDTRIEARRLLNAYLDRPLNAIRHEPLVKRLFKFADNAGDDVVMARFLVAFDRSVRRRMTTRRRWNYRQRNWDESSVVTQAVPSRARLSGVGTLNSSLTGRRTERLKSE